MGEHKALDPFAVALSGVIGPAILCEDADGRVLLANDAWVRLVDGDAAQHDPFDLLARLDPDEVDRAREKLTRGLETVQPVEFQTRIAYDHTAGDWVTVSRIPIRDAAGALAGWVTSIVGLVGHLDPLGLSGIELTQEEKEARLAGIGAWELQVATGELWWSGGVYTMFDRDPGSYEPSYEHFLETIYPPDRDEVVRRTEAALAGGPAYDVRHRIARPDGEIRFVREKAEVERGPQGEPVRMIGTVEDVTDEVIEARHRRRAAKALTTLSKANEVLVHATDEETLLQQMCAAAVETGGYAMAWYGRLRPEGALEVLALDMLGPAQAYAQALGLVPGHLVDLPNAALQEVIVDDFRIGAEPWRQSARDCGLSSMVTLPVRHDEVLDGFLVVYSREREAFDAGALNILQEVAQELGFGLGRLYANRRITGALEGTIKVLAATVELRDPYTAGHQAQVSYLATRIAREMALSESEAHALGLAGLVHDIGKVTVPTEFLTRPGALRPAEFELIKDHARIGEELLSSIDFPWPIATIVGQHHERLDGSGYPRGLVGDEILLPSRIMAVADVVEAMSRFRPYREALGEDRAIEEIRTKRGTLFDPDAVDACLSILESGHAFEVSV
jgi:putative nucleotidyltransferase with HDIG domain